jgi:hypothetical protein
MLFGVLSIKSRLSLLLYIPEFRVFLPKGLAKAAAVIRDTREPATLKAGDSVPTGKAFLDQDLNTVIEARVREGFGLPPNATEEQVNAQLEAHMAARSTPMPAPANVNPTMNETQFPSEK